MRRILSRRAAGSKVKDPGFGNWEFRIARMTGLGLIRISDSYGIWKRVSVIASGITPTALISIAQSIASVHRCQILKSQIPILREQSMGRCNRKLLNHQGSFWKLDLKAVVTQLDPLDCELAHRVGSCRQKPLISAH